VATPIATPTPTITPTPIIYTVQPGDTILKIALQFDRSNEAIQEANGIVDPRFLQIGQVLVIPPPVESPDDPPTPTPTPYPVNVTAINFQETRSGALWCLGTVTNPGNIPLTQVVIEVSLLDGEGVLLAREAAFTQLDVVQPGQAAPFAILFEIPPTDFAQYQAVAVSAVRLSAQTRYYFDLETFDLRGSAEGLATYRVRGQLRNTGPVDAQAVRLVIVAYDQDNQVLAQRQAELAVSLLKAGATTPFEVDLIIPKGVVDHFEVLAEGLLAQ
jgi:LysM repeat protein